MSFKATATNVAHEPTLHCPNCNYEIRLTESLAAPLIEETRRRFQEQLANKDAEVARRTEALRQEREQLVKAREQIEDQVAQRLAAERSQLVAAEARKAREASATELQSKVAEADELRKTLETNNAKLLLLGWNVLRRPERHIELRGQNRGNGGQGVWKVEALPVATQFQALRRLMEDKWTLQMMGTLGIAEASLPVIWDADFLYGPRDAANAETYVLCEINVSSCFAIPDEAPAAISRMVRHRIRSSLRS
jgi:hypothetical protein